MRISDWSSDVCSSDLDTPVAFLPRHGRGHRLTPTELNYRANIAALKMVGCTDVLSVSACGSFREELPPGTFVLVDQYVDRTRRRTNSFFGDGVETGREAGREQVCQEV